MQKRHFIFLSILTIALGAIPVARAGTISATGSVSALTDVSQLVGVRGTAYYNQDQVALDEYSDSGMTFHTGAFSSILPGVTESGTAYRPQCNTSYITYFREPVAGGGTFGGNINLYGGVVTFDVPVTQFGLTGGRNGTMYLTAWDTAGELLGQVTWVPSGATAFVGIDTSGTQIGMLSYGNDDVFNGATYGIGGATIMSDNWMWASGEQPAGVPEPATLSLLALGGLALLRRRRKK